MIGYGIVALFAIVSLWVLMYVWSHEARLGSIARELGIGDAIVRQLLTTHKTDVLLAIVRQIALTRFRELHRRVVELLDTIEEQTSSGMDRDYFWKDLFDRTDETYLNAATYDSCTELRYIMMDVRQYVSTPDTSCEYEQLERELNGLRAVYRRLESVTRKLKRPELEPVS